MATQFLNHISETLTQIEADGLYKRERMITSAQAGTIKVGTRDVINLCAQQLSWSGRSSRSDCSRQTGHGRQGLWHGIRPLHLRHTGSAPRVGTEAGDVPWQEDSILFAACFDANGGLFEPLLTSEDAIISDSLNHASIIDGIRLCKAQRYRYANNDMDDLEAKLKRPARRAHVTS